MRFDFGLNYYKDVWGIELLVQISSSEQIHGSRSNNISEQVARWDKWATRQCESSSNYYFKCRLASQKDDCFSLKVWPYSPKD